MLKYVKCALLALAVAMAGCLACSAAANTITVRPAGAITMTSEGDLSFMAEGLITIELHCPVTLNGNFNRTIANARGGVLGSITEGSVGTCNTGSAGVLAEAAEVWRLELAEPSRLEGMPKLLPVNFVGVKIRVEAAGQRCLYEGTILMQLEAEGPREAVGTRRFRVFVNSMSRVEGNFFCPNTGRIRGLFRMTTQTLAL